MINLLNGTIKDIKDQQVTLEVAGVGFAVHVAHTHHLVKDKATHLYTYLHWNQEQGPSLFGFSSELERTIFLLVTSCSGIGPKIGLALLAQLQPHEILKAIQTDDHKVLSAVSGIGPKKAEQIIVQLRHKAAKLLESANIPIQDKTLEHWKNISDVLISLNYSRSEVHNALAHLKTAQQDATFDQLMRTALSFLSKRL